MKRFKTHLSALALALLMSVSLLPMGATAARDTGNADRLYSLGLFKGTGHGYSLEETATRMQGLIMLTRLLGEEEAALATEEVCPFTDVAPGNPSRYVAYGYAKHYTAGTSETSFSPGNQIGFKHYVTFLLRALGYDDSKAVQDFTFATSLDKAAEIGMMDPASAQLIKAQNPVFYRGDLVDLSIAALTTDLKDGSGTLAERLAANGVFSYGDGDQQGVLYNGRSPYVYTATAVTPPAPAKPAVPANSSAISRKTGKYAVASGSVAADIITVNVQDPSIRVRTAMVDNTIGHTANFKDIVANSSAQVIVDGNFFEAYNPSKFPIGHVMVDGQFLYGVSGLSSMGFTEDGQIVVGRPAVFFFVEGSGKSWACYEANSRGQAPDTSVLYNPGFGKSVTLTCDGVITTVVGGSVQSTGYMPTGSVVPIPANGFVMFFGNAFASTDYYRTPEVGDSLAITPRLMKDDPNGFQMEGVTSIVSGAPRLVEGGAICTTLEPGFQEARFTTNSSPRTAVGKTYDGKLVIVSTPAATIQQLRELMLQLGCVDAFNLDGGASTALAYQGKIVRNAGRPLTSTLQVFVQ